MDIKSKWRGFTVTVVRHLQEAFVIDEQQRLVNVRRDYLRPWRMLSALVDAMNVLAERDDAWATKADAKPMMLGTQRLVLGGKEWKLQCCSVLLDKSGNADDVSLRPIDVDWEAREIRVCTRFNFGFGAPALAEAIADITHDGIYEMIEDVHDRLAGSSCGDSRRAIAEFEQGAATIGRPSNAA